MSYIYHVRIMLKATHTKREKVLRIYPRKAFRTSVKTAERIARIAVREGASESWVINRALAKALPAMERE